MMHVTPMSKVMIIGPKTYQEKVINRMYELNAYHIKEHRKTEQLDIGRPLAKAERLSDILVKLRGVISALSIDGEMHAHPPQAKTMTEKEYYDLGKKSKLLYEQINTILERIRTIEEQQAILKSKLEIAQLLHVLNITFDVLRPSGHLLHAIGMIENKHMAKQLDLELKQATSRYELVVKEQKKSAAIVVFYPRDQHDKIGAVLQKYQFKEQDLNPVKDMKGSPLLALRQFQAIGKRLAQEHAALKGKLAGLRDSNREFLLQNEGILAEELKKAEAPLRFAETRETFMVDGFVPKKDVLAFAQDLNRVANETLHVEINGLEKEKEIPIKLDNPGPVKPFEFFMDMYSLPSYREFDPSLLLFITFPIFFGMMLGDIGYGLTTFLLFLFLKQKMPSAKALLNIMILASVISIGFGAAFGEVFGFEHLSERTGEKLCTMGLCLPKATVQEDGVTETIYNFPRLLNRFHDTATIFGYSLPAVLVVGMAVGVIHVNLAILIGFLNVLSAHGLLHAVEEKLSWMILEIGIVIAAAWSTWVGIGIIILAFALLYKGEGVQGLIEVPALLTNILSYMRIGAVGLASVGLAMVVNEKFVLPNIEKGGVFIIIGIIIMIIGHAVNIALGVIGPFLHSLRLHYVEFFSRFYKGGGIRYIPFGYDHETE